MNKREGSFCDLLTVDNIANMDFEHFNTITEIMDFVFLEKNLAINEVNILKKFRSFISANKVGQSADSMESVEDIVQKSVTYFDATVSRKDQIDKNIENEMYHAFEAEEFQIYLQPKVLIANTEVVGAEVLARWIHPNKGILTADTFIPVFENNGFIIKLDYLIWEKTFAAVRRWLDKAYPVVPVSINISRIHLSNNEFINHLIYLSKKYKVLPIYIELEFTETVALKKVDELKPMFHWLKREGFILALDDFGAGYSSLDMLKDLLIDIIKIDCAFLNETSTSSNDRTVIKYVIDMVNKFNMKVVAVGVKDFAQAEFWYHAGCDTAQGYFYSKPLSEAEFEQYTYNSF